MGEERIITGTQLFFCKAEDLKIDTENWTEVKQVDSICLRDKTTVPELEVKEPWPTSFSFTATVENTDEIFKFHQKLREHQSRRFHYIQQIMPIETKDYFRKFSLALKVKKLKKKRL
jgi:hypothetical protein